MKKTNTIIIIGLLTISYLIFVYLYISKINLFKKDEYVYVKKADTLEKDVVILRRFENLKLFKQNNKNNDKLFYNKDIEVIRDFIRRNPHTIGDSSYKIESHLKYGELYDSPYLVQNYNKLPDTIFANGYHIMYASDFKLMQEYIGKQIRVLSYKYKK